MKLSENKGGPELSELSKKIIQIILKIMFLRILDIIVCSGAMLVAVLSASYLVKFMLEVGFSSPLVLLAFGQTETGPASRVSEQTDVVRGYC